MSTGSRLPFYIHNSVVQPDSLPFKPQRLPDELVPHMNPSGGGAMRQVANTEIRFRLKPGTSARIVLRAERQPTSITAFYGDYQGSLAQILRPEETLEIQVAPAARYLEYCEKGWVRRHRFAPELVRVCLMGSYVEIVDVSGEGITPPLPGDAPAQRLLCCGSSITHGMFGCGPQVTYPELLGVRLGMDVINLGLRGGFQAEPQYADYLAEWRDWDVATVELSANMSGKPNDYFYERARYFCDRLSAAKPTRPIFAISLFTSWRDVATDAENEEGRLGHDKRTLLAQIVRELNRPNLHFVSGNELIPYAHGLADDHVHLGDGGFIQIAENLSRIVRSRI